MIFSNATFRNNVNIYHISKNFSPDVDYAQIAVLFTNIKRQYKNIMHLNAGSRMIFGICSCERVRCLTASSNLSLLISSSRNFDRRFCKVQLSSVIIFDIVYT